MGLEQVSPCPSKRRPGRQQRTRPWSRLLPDRMLSAGAVALQQRQRHARKVGEAHRGNEQAPDVQAAGDPERSSRCAASGARGRASAAAQRQCLKTRQAQRTHRRCSGGA